MFKIKILVLVLFVFLAGCSATNSPEETVENFLIDINEGRDIEGVVDNYLIKDDLPDNLINLLGEMQMAQIDWDINFEVSKEELEEGVYQIRTTGEAMSPEGITVDFNERFYVVDINGEWRIDPTSPYFP